MEIIENENQPGCGQLFQEFAYRAEARLRHGLHGGRPALSVEVRGQPCEGAQLLVLPGRKPLHRRTHKIVLVVERVREQTERRVGILLIDSSGEHPRVSGTGDTGEPPQYRRLTDSRISRYFDEAGDRLSWPDVPESVTEYIKDILPAEQGLCVRGSRCKTCGVPRFRIGRDSGLTWIASRTGHLSPPAVPTGCICGDVDRTPVIRPLRSHASSRRGGRTGVIAVKYCPSLLESACRPSTSCRPRARMLTGTCRGSG